jgi:hypothetical protein
MATLISKATGNFTAAGTWAVADTTSLLDSENTSSQSSTAFVSCPAFVPGAITVDSIGLKINTLVASPTGTFAVMLGKNGNVSSVSIANPTTITTSAPHGLVSGEAVTIAGTTTSTSVNGAFTVTVTGASTFTIPVNVTSVTTGTGTWATTKAAIVSNTSAASTVITTSVVHGLTTGATITIKGSTASPSLDGSYTVTVITTSTFSIPVNTTGGGFASGTGVYNINAVTDTLCVVNAADLGATSALGWANFLLPAPITLVAAVQYDVRLTSSVSSTLTVFRSATTADWARFLRTTTTQAPVASDILNVCGEYTGRGTSNTLTVTMDNTAATVFGKIETSGKGILSCGTAASTAYLLTTNGAAGAGDFRVNGNGIVRFGTAGTPIPATSTMTLIIKQNAVAVTNAILIRGNGNFTTFGSAKTQKAFLNADAAAAATTITTDTSTGWLSGDSLVIASTTRTAAESEVKVMSANATGTSVPIAALTNAHSGTGATKGEVGNLTRNVKIQGESITLTAYVSLGAESVFDFNNTEVYFMGSTTATKRGVDVFTTTGSATIDGCVWRDFTNGSSFGFLLNTPTNANFSISNTNFYNLISGLAFNSTSITASTIVANNILGVSAPFTFNNQAGSITNITAVSTTMTFGQIATSNLTVNNIIAHSSTAAGISISANPLEKLILGNVTVWRNSVRGIFFSSANNCQIDTGTVFGNGTYGVEVNTSSLIYLNNITANAGTTLTQPLALALTTSSTQVFLDTCSFGATTAHSTGDISYVTSKAFHEVFMTNCLLASSTEVATQTNMAAGSVIGSIKHDQTTGTHKVFKRSRIVTSDALINLTASLSQRLTPNTAATKTQTNDRMFSIPNGKTAKVTVGVRRSVAGDGTAYNGALPRLWLRSNNSAGIAADTLLATATVASLGSWEFITGTVSAANDNTINSVYVDLDGTTGWVNLDVWKLEIINGSANGGNTNGEDYWNYGEPFTGINTLILRNSGHETFWLLDGPSSELFPISAAETGKFFLSF